MHTIHKLKLVISTVCILQCFHIICSHNNQESSLSRHARAIQQAQNFEYPQHFQYRMQQYGNHLFPSTHKMTRCMQHDTRMQQCEIEQARKKTEVKARRDVAFGTTYPESKPKKAQTHQERFGPKPDHTITRMQIGITAPKLKPEDIFAEDNDLMDFVKYTDLLQNLEKPGITRPSIERKLFFADRAFKKYHGYTDGEMKYLRDQHSVIVDKILQARKKYLTQHQPYCFQPRYKLPQSNL